MCKQGHGVQSGNKTRRNFSGPKQ
jgi:hypothetical protein